MKRFVAAIALGLFVSACSNPRTQVVTSANRDQILTTVAQSNAFPSDDKILFAGFIMRATMSGAMPFASAADKVSYEGKTVGQIIEEQRAFMAARKSADDKEARLAADAKAKADAAAIEIAKALTVAVFDKEATAMPGYTYLKLVAENTSAKDIRGFTGHLKVQDMFGADVDDIFVKVTDPIKAGAKRQWNEISTHSQVSKSNLKGSEVYVGA